MGIEVHRAQRPLLKRSLLSVPRTEDPREVLVKLLFSFLFSSCSQSHICEVGAKVIAVFAV